MFGYELSKQIPEASPAKFGNSLFSLLNLVEERCFAEFPVLI